MKRFLLILDPDRSPEQRASVEALPARIVASYGESVLEVEMDDEAVLTEVDLRVPGLFEGTVDLDPTGLDETGRLAVAAWNERHSEAFTKRKRRRPGAGRSWDESPDDI